MVGNSNIGVLSIQSLIGRGYRDTSATTWLILKDDQDGWNRYFSTLETETGKSVSGSVGLLVYPGPYFEHYSGILRGGPPRRAGQEESQQQRQLLEMAIAEWDHSLSAVAVERARRYISAVATHSSRILQYLSSSQKSACQSQQKQQQATPHSALFLHRSAQVPRSDNARSQLQIQSQGGNKNIFEGWKWVYEICRTVNAAVTLCLKADDAECHETICKALSTLSSTMEPVNMDCETPDPKQAHSFCLSQMRFKLLSCGIVYAMQQWLHYATFGEPLDAKESKDSSVAASQRQPYMCGATPFHAEWYQLCTSLRVSRFALRFHCSHTLETENDTSSTLDALHGTCLIPITTVDQFMDYYYQLGRLYTACRSYDKAIDAYNLVLATPTVTAATEMRGGMQGTSVVQSTFQQSQGGGLLTSSSANATLSSVLINAIQISARKKQLLVACLLASQAHNTSMTSVELKKSVPATQMMDHTSLFPTGEEMDDDNAQHTVEDEDDEGLIPEPEPEMAIPPIPELHQQGGDVVMAEEDENVMALAQQQQQQHLQQPDVHLPVNQEKSALLESTLGRNYPWTLPPYISKSVARVLSSPFAVTTSSLQAPSRSGISFFENPVSLQNTASAAANQAANHQSDALAAEYGLPLYYAFIKSYFLGQTAALEEHLSSSVHGITITSAHPPVKTKVNLVDFAKRDGNYNLCLEMLHAAIKLRKAHCIASIFEAASFDVCDHECISTKDQSNQQQVRMHSFAMSLASSLLLSPQSVSVDFVPIVDQQSRMIYFLDPLLHQQDEQLELEEQDCLDDYLPTLDADDNCHLSESLKKVMDLTHRMTEIDIDIATSKRYRMLQSIKDGSSSSSAATAVSSSSPSVILGNVVGGAGHAWS